MIENPNAIFDYASEPKAKVTECPVCGSHVGHVLKPDCRRMNDRYGYDVLWCRCSTCSLEFLGEQMTRAGYARFYAGGYRALVDAYTGRGQRIRTDDHPTVKALEALVCELVGVHPIRTILDAGGSAGSVGRAVAARYGGTFAVLDPAFQEMPADVTRIHGWLEDPIPGDYDLALCVATSDHLTDPLAALKHLRRVSRYLYIDYIDVQLMRATNQTPALKIDHPLYWTSRSMRRALKASGWTPYAGRVVGDRGRYTVSAVACH